MWEVYLNEYTTFNDALANIDRFIEEVCNSKRLHSSIGYKSPVNFEKMLILNSSLTDCLLIGRSLGLPELVVDIKSLKG